MSNHNTRTPASTPVVRPVPDGAMRPVSPLAVIPTTRLTPAREIYTPPFGRQEHVDLTTHHAVLPPRSPLQRLPSLPPSPDLPDSKFIHLDYIPLCSDSLNFVVAEVIRQIPPRVAASTVTGNGAGS